MTLAEAQSLKPNDTVRYEGEIYTIKKIEIRPTIWTVIVETSTGKVFECFAYELS